MEKVKYRALCIKDWKISQIQFYSGIYYTYTIKKHSESGLNIFTIEYSGNSGIIDLIPTTELTFKKFFNPIQDIRNKKIDYLLTQK